MNLTDRAQRLPAPASHSPSSLRPRPSRCSWSPILVKVVIWLTAEILLNVLGLDDLADYSEFIFERHAAIAPPNAVAMVIALPPTVMLEAASDSNL